MESLELSFQIVGPMFMVMAVGYLVKKAGMLSPAAISQVSKVTFRLFLSAMMFQNIYECDIRQVWNGREVLVNIALTVLNFIFAAAIARAMRPRDRAVQGALAQGMFQNSYVTFGVPIVTAAFGAAGGALVGMMSALMVPLRNVIIIAYLSVENGEKNDPKRIVLSVLKNPYLLAGALGLAVGLLRIRLPHVLAETVSSLARIGAPLALFLLGATLDFRSMAGYRKELLLCVLYKMIVIPTVLLPVAVLLGFRNASLLSTCVMLAAPGATTAHIVAREMGTDSDLAGQATVVTASVAALIFFVYIFVLRQLGLI